MEKFKWGYIPLGIIMFICLGTVYSWSVFRRPLEEIFHIGATESGLPYMLFLAFYALFMLLTGPFIEKYHPRKIMILGSLLVGGGWILSGYTNHIGLLSLTYGVVAGSGVGIIYGVPVAVISKWFPKKKGFAVGLILSGFGISPLITAPLAEYLINQKGALETFKILGVVFLILLLVLSLPFRFPMGSTLEAQNKKNQKGRYDVNGGDKNLYKNRKFYGLWVCYGLGTLVGLMAVGITSPIGIEIVGLDAKTTTIFVSMFALFNGIGRPIFGWLTDYIGPMKAAILSNLMIITASGLMLMGGENNVVIYIISFSIIWMTLGSWLAIAPTATGMYFGTENQSRNYGIVFTAYGVGALLGVSLSGISKDIFGSYFYTFYQMLGIGLIGIILALIFLKEK